MVLLHSWGENELRANLVWDIHAHIHGILSILKQNAFPIAIHLKEKLKQS